MTNTQLILTILGCALITFLLRAFPFLLFGGKREISPMIRELGEKLPYAVMGVLVIYCLKGIVAGGLSGMELSTALPPLAASLMVVLVHLWKRNTILSIFLGTVCYMVLIRIL